MDVSPDELLSRKDTLKQFENYIDNTRNTLKCFVEKIGWTLDKTKIDDELVQCPLNSEHRMPPSKLEVHCQKCILKKKGYDSTHSFYPSYNLSTPLGQSVKIDEITQMRILKTAYEESNSTLNMIKECLVQDILQYFIIHYEKKTYINLEPREVSQSIERYVCDFTPDERRVLYDSAVKYTNLPNHMNIKNDLTGMEVFNKTDEKPKTEIELLQEQRDLKRRRAAYRGKRVHTDRKSYFEVLRDVVEGLTNNLSNPEDKSEHVQNSNTVFNTETMSNNRFMYKYEGTRYFGGNPYTRWLDIQTEESMLFKYYENKSKSSYQEASTSGMHYQDKIGLKKSRKSRSKSRERKMSTSELKLKRSRRSRSCSVYKETTSKRSKIRSKSKESISVINKHKRSKKRNTRSKSRESNRKRSKKCRTRSKSKQLEKDTTIQFKSNDHNKKKKKHKSKKKRSRSPRK